MTCIEVGGSSTQSVVFARERPPVITDGVPARDAIDGVLAIAVPGIVRDGRVVAASNLDWYDVDPAEQLGLAGTGAGTTILLNDAQAAALGESMLRDGADLVYVGLGTGVGGAVVVDGEVVADNLFGHSPGFSDARCPCTRTGCLETVAAGWALPTPIPEGRIQSIGRDVAAAVEREPVATAPLVIVGGGLAHHYAAIVDAVGDALPGLAVEPSAAPPAAKSAAAWGLLHTYLRNGSVTR